MFLSLAGARGCRRCDRAPHGGITSANKLGLWRRHVGASGGDYRSAAAATACCMRLPGSAPSSEPSPSCPSGVSDDRPRTPEVVCPGTARPPRWRFRPCSTSGSARPHPLDYLDGPTFALRPCEEAHDAGRKSPLPATPRVGEVTAAIPPQAISIAMMPEVPPFALRLDHVIKMPNPIEVTAKFRAGLPECADV